jgi:succinate dehydrogenase hydrophobic anchor subunit
VLPIIALGIVLAAAIGWFLWERAITAANARGTELAAAQARARADQEQAEAERQRWQRNPADAIEAALHRNAPLRRQHEHAVQDAEDTAAHQRSATEAMMTEFPGGVAPPRLRSIVVSMLCLFWLIAFTGQLLLDYPIFFNVTGGNFWNALLMTLVVTSVLAAASVGLAMIRTLHPAGGRPQSPRALRAATVGILAVFLLVLGVMVQLAPKRAELDYAAPVQTASQQMTRFTEDGDLTGAAFKKIELDRLTQEEQQAAATYQALALIAGGFEFLAGLAVPGGLHTLALTRARRRERHAQVLLRQAKQTQQMQRETEIQEISANLLAAGTPQNQIPAILAGIGNPPAPRPGPPDASHHENPAAGHTPEATDDIPHTEEHRPAEADHEPGFPVPPGNPEPNNATGTPRPLPETDTPDDRHPNTDLFDQS